MVAVGEAEVCPLALAWVKVDEHRVVGGSEPALAEVEVHTGEAGLPAGPEQGQPGRAGEGGEDAATRSADLEGPVFSSFPFRPGTMLVRGEVFKAIYSS
ncbi:MAG: hypothetical protein ACLT98_00730 [Eggerthellaceae bacterium]